jgi:Protein of unknown function (DUF2752)
MSDPNQPYDFCGHRDLAMTAPVRRPDARAAISRSYVAAGVALLGVGADVAFDPVHRHVPLCPFHAVSGWWCPLCGSLRAVDALAHGRVPAAVHDNLLLVAVLPLLAWWWVDTLRRARGSRPRRAVAAVAVVALVALATVFTIVRNGPFGAALRPQ